MTALTNAAVARGQGRKWRPTADELREIQQRKPHSTGAESGKTGPAESDRKPPKSAESTGSEGNPPPPDAPPADSKIHDAEGNLIRDADGRTWDTRIHAPSQMILKGNKCWKRKRNIPDDLIHQVHAEQDARDGNGDEGQDKPPAPPEATGTQDSDKPPAPPAESNGDTDKSAITLFIEKANAENISITDIRAAIKTVGVPSMVQLQNHPDKLAEVEALLFG